MNKKNFKFVIAFIIFFIMIFGLLVSQIGSFAVVAEKPIYINSTLKKIFIDNINKGKQYY